MSNINIKYQRGIQADILPLYNFDVARTEVHINMYGMFYWFYYSSRSHPLISRFLCL